MTANPLAEVFGFPASNDSEEARRYRRLKLCPFNNIVPSCTKDKAQDPLGVCSINDRDSHAITCPIRFREDWLIAEDAAKFFFKPEESWTSLTEIRLTDKDGNPAGNIDIVLVSYDERGKITDFGCVEVQGVYISGNVRKPFQEFMNCSLNRTKFDWSNNRLSPRPDYLSSSRKRLVPQLIFKGGILHSWNKKMAVVIHDGFFSTLPDLPEVDRSDADIALLVYSLKKNEDGSRLNLTRNKTVYTKFNEALDTISIPRPGNVDSFLGILQNKLDEKFEQDNPPETHTLADLLKNEKE